MSSAVIELVELTEALDDDGRYGPGTGSPPVTVDDGRYGPGTGSPPVTVWAKAPLQTGVKARKARSKADFFAECWDTVYLLERLLR